jgi:DNA-binding HxlR family transcriptional regulator
MSIQHVAAILDSRHPSLSGCRKLVLVTLANRTDEHFRCWPSQERLAGECGISVRALSDHLKALEEDGFITRDTQHLGQGNGSRTVYTLRLEALTFAPAEIAPAEIAHANSVVCTGSRPRVTNHQEPSTSSSSDARANAIDRILNACGPGMLDPTKSASPLLDLRARVGRWLEVWDLETEILPVVEAKTSRPRKGRPMSHFGFIEEDIAVFHAKRVSKTPEVEIFDVNANLGGGEPRRRGPGPAGQPAARYASGGHGAFGAGESGRGSIADAAIRRHLHRQNGNGVPGGDERGSDVSAEAVIVDADYRLVG